MERLAGPILIGLLLTTAALSQTIKRPAFSQYSVPVERARVKAINFHKNPDASTFRTRLSEAIRGGVNFAGHYVVAGWGCGTGCISGAIIEARTGDVYWPEQFNALSVWYGESEYENEPVKYRKNSRLLVLVGSPGVKDGSPEKPAGEYYYEWKGNRLRLIKYIERKTN